MKLGKALFAAGAAVDGAVLQFGNSDVGGPVPKEFNQCPNPAGQERSFSADYEDFASRVSFAEISAIPNGFACTARHAAEWGGGVHIHAAHGFLLSQFLSLLFNRRTDIYGGPIHARMRLLVETFEAVRAAVLADFVVGVTNFAASELAAAPARPLRLFWRRRSGDARL